MGVILVSKEAKLSRQVSLTIKERMCSQDRHFPLPVQHNKFEKRE
jgi:hypothetical protein